MKNSILTSLLILAIAFSGLSQSKKPVSARPTLGSADTLYLASKWEAARKAYESHLQVAQKGTIKPVTYFRLANCYHNLKNYDAALKNYLYALEQKPASQIKPALFSRMARTYAMKGNAASSLMSLDSAARNGYAGLNEMDTLKDFTSIRADKRFETIYKQVYGNAYPCSLDQNYRKFDFWVGEWDVYVTGTTNPIVGHSLIQKVAGECLILENWTALGAAPNTGKSMNYYDAAKKTWEQVWMGSGAGLQRFIEGEYKDGAMRFTFDPALPNVQKSLGRFSFFNEGPNQVRQFNETSVDDGKTWQTSYDLTYIRKQKK